MSNEFDSVDELIEEKHGHMPSSDDQQTLYHQLSNDGVYSSTEERLRTVQVDEKYGDDLDHGTTGVLENLEDLEILDKFEPRGARSFIRNERTDEMFFSPSEDGFVKSFEEEQTRLINDLEPIQPAEDEEVKLAEVTTDGGHITRREVVADTLSVPEPLVEQTLTGPMDVIDQMTLFDDSVKAIEDHQDVVKEGEYGTMGWRNRANRWAISEYAEDLDS